MTAPIAKRLICMVVRRGPYGCRVIARRLPHGPGFMVVEADGEVELSVTGPWTSQTARVVRSGRIDRVVLNYARGFRESDIEFLRGLPIRGLDIMSYTLTDLSPIYSLSETLMGLSVGRLPGPIDLERLPRLRTLSTDWTSVESTVHHASGIEDLHLQGYRAHDLHPLGHLTRLNRLRLKHYPNVRTLDGLQAFDLLEDLLVVGARQLTDITAVADPTLNKLSSLNLDTCRKITDLEPVGRRRELTSLNAGNCGDLPTVAPLSNLTRLEILHLYESTNVLDGDLTPIAELPELRDLAMMNRRHYRPSVQEIQRSMTSR